MSEISNSLTAANKINDAILKQHSALSTKLDTAQTGNFELQREDEQAQAEFSECERRHILDSATDSELEATQSKADNIRQRLQASTRRMELIREALNDHNLKISASLQNLRIVRRDFCINVRDSKLHEIQNDKRLRTALIIAMSAQASTGMESYTNDAKQFVQQFLARILPEISEAEVRAETEKFKTDNELN